MKRNTRTTVKPLSEMTTLPDADLEAVSGGSIGPRPTRQCVTPVSPTGEFIYDDQ